MKRYFTDPVPYEHEMGDFVKHEDIQKRDIELKILVKNIFDIWHGQDMNDMENQLRLNYHLKLLFKYAGLEEVTELK